MHHGTAPGSEHQVALAHQFIGGLEARGFDADHQILGCAHFLQRGAHQVTDFFVGQLGSWVGRNNDRIPAFDGVNAFDNGGRFRVGRGRQCADYSQRLGEDANVALGIFLNDANGLVVNDVEEGGAGFALDLQEFAVVVAELGFIDSELGNLFCHTRPRHGPHHGSDQRIDLLLRIVLDLFLCGA